MPLNFQHFLIATATNAHSTKKPCQIRRRYQITHDFTLFFTSSPNQVERKKKKLKIGVAKKWAANFSYWEKSNAEMNANFNEFVVRTCFWCGYWSYMLTSRKWIFFFFFFFYFSSFFPLFTHIFVKRFAIIVISMFHGYFFSYKWSITSTTQCNYWNTISPTIIINNIFFFFL